jgi:hypothetical protein
MILRKPSSVILWLSKHNSLHIHVSEGVSRIVLSHGGGRCRAIVKAMMILGFHKTHGISWLMDPLFSSQAGLCSVEWSSYSPVPLFIDSFHTTLRTCFEVSNSAPTGSLVEASWNVMARAQKPDFVFRWNGRVHLNRRGLRFSRLLAAEVFASAVVMLDTPCFEVVWRVLVTYSIRKFPLHLPFRASPCAITFQLESTYHGRLCVAIEFGL